MKKIHIVSIHSIYYLEVNDLAGLWREGRDFTLTVLAHHFGAHVNLAQDTLLAAEADTYITDEQV